MQSLKALVKPMDVDIVKHVFGHNGTITIDNGSTDGQFKLA